MLQDIATLTGGTVISEDVGLKLETMTLDQLGQSKLVRITKTTPLSLMVAVKKLTSMHALLKSVLKSKIQALTTIVKNYKSV